MTNLPVLSPCPFCGVQAEYNFVYQSVGCNNDECDIQPWTNHCETGDSDEWIKIASDIWNRRAILHKKLFSAADEMKFKQQYVIQYMAAYVAIKTDECNSRGRHDTLRKPPVEDAKHLANTAWEHWVDIIGLE